MELTLYWSMFPGRYVNKLSGEDTDGPKFKGGHSLWREQLVKTIVEAGSMLQRLAFTQWGACSLVSFDAYASTASRLLETSVLWKPTQVNDQTTRDAHPDDELLFEPVVRQAADFDVFKFFYDRAATSDSIRLHVTFVDRLGEQRSLYGNVKILDMPDTW